MIGSKFWKYVHFLQKFGRWDLKFRCPTLVILFSGSMVSVFPCLPRFFLHSKTSQKGILMSPNNLYVWWFLKVNPSKHCLCPTHFQCHLLRFACSVVGKMKTNLPNGGFFIVIYPGKKEEKKTSPQNQTNPKNISTCWIFGSTLKHTKRALPSDMILRIKMTWNANPLKLPRSKWKNWDMSLLHSLRWVFDGEKFHREKWWDATLHYQPHIHLV